MFEDIKLNDSGDRVKILQEKLKMLGYYNAIITGNYQKATEIGVKAFQKKEGLPVTGIVNLETWNRLNNYTETRINAVRALPTLSFGSTGNSVKDLQTKLKALLYYSGSINGSFDLETENAVKRFQLNNELIATGVVNLETWNLLNSLYGNLAPCAIENDTNDNENLDDYYIVKKGDTLYSIAKKYNTTVDTIKSLNNLENDTLEIGQVLKIPEIDNNDYINYVVKSGDTLYSIAKNYNTTVEDIKRLNNLENNILNIGQVLRIPIKENNDYTNYIVKTGDTLYSIAKRFGISVDELKSLNDLQNNLISLGQILKIPNSSNEYIDYIVKKGDTLYSIAKKYNTTVNEIQSLNNLTTNNLSIDQILKIPNN